MSLTKLFLCGLLVAGGLVLGAFTLHGYFDPQWTQKQAQAATIKAPERVPDVPSINAFQGRSRFVATRSVPPTPEVKAPSAVPPAVKASAGPDAAAADTKAAAKPAPKKKVADRPAEKAKSPPPQQASFQRTWPKLFGSN